MIGPKTYQEWLAASSRRRSPRDFPTTIFKRLCYNPYCNNSAIPGQRCYLHSDRWVDRWVEPTPPAPPPTCDFEGCGKLVRARKLCDGHYDQARMGRPLTALRSRDGSVNWRVNDRGYVVGYRVIDGKRKQVRQHCEVMEEHLGRPLQEHERIHHLNGDRSDNRIQNLELWSISQPAGQRVRDKVAWAKELLGQYEPEALRDLAA